ncbi:MAG: TonB-dependent receptor family protein [Panacagrimonas sp.]
MTRARFGGLLIAALAAPVSATEPATSPSTAVAKLEVLDVVTVVGNSDQAQDVPGAVTVLDSAELEASRVVTTNEALRKAPGLNVRDEEGFGLRPNIGVRGLNPTRSTKVLLLEDGIPLAYAPYGDNASYYHPPVDRFDRIEVLKGSSMNLYGPQTIGAVINYITPNPTRDFQGKVSVAGGNRDFFDAQGRVGAENLLFDFVRKQGDGARDNLHSEIEDYNIKALLNLASDQTLILRANRYTEDSDLTYSGLSDAEFANFGREYNPFKNDTFDVKRNGVSASHELRFGGDDSVVTQLYYSNFSRDWWRQSSTTTDSQCGAQFTADRLAGLRVEPDTCNSAQGRLRDYHSYGVEPRLRLTHALAGPDNELVIGLRAHKETQSRLQENGTTPTARDGVRVENNRRETEAYAVFVQNRFGFGRFSITPGLRFESIDYLRRNRLNGVEGDDTLDEIIPSLGATFEINPSYTAFASVHRGFAPPRTEDIIGGNGVAVDVDAEDSVNAEIGLRGRPHKGLRFEAVAFRNDFDNLIAVGSIAGGSTPLSQGKAVFEGFELSGRADFGKFMDSPHNPFVAIAYTAIPTAESDGAFECLVVSGGCTAVGQALPGSADGRRLPYAPKNLFTGTLGYAHPVGFEVRVEAVFIDEQYADFANTRDASPTGNGQSGQLADYTLWNAALNWRLPGSKWTVFAASKNLGDKTYIADRTRGIQTGMPRLVQAGLEYEF